LIEKRILKIINDDLLVIIMLAKQTLFVIDEVIILIGEMIVVAGIILAS
jgi:hypothetical protein